ncbi:MAG: glycosyltransferase [Gemmatimonadota bacterium]
MKGGSLLVMGTGGYVLMLLLLIPFGLHRLWLVWLRLRTPPRREPWRPAAAERIGFPLVSPTSSGAFAWPGGELPVVTVQLPIYNEANVASRLIDAACRLDYPRDRLEVQVLDDSDDITSRIVAERSACWRARGVSIRHLRRTGRAGFKAGALAEGARTALGEFFLVLDADFVPPPDLIHRLLPSFRDPSVGAAQAAWAHLNAGDSWLTRAQALFLDAHFAIEHEARYRAGLFFNFNGSAGMWRRRCLEDAGGWTSDTLTEDLDLSYRAQLRGWRLVYHDDVRVPAELPMGLGPLELQQARWAQGGVQTAVKLLPRLWRSSVRNAVKWEGTAHLLGNAVHPLTLLLGVSLSLIGYFGPTGGVLPWWVHMSALGLATLPFVVFYGLAAHLRGYRALNAAPRIVEAMLLGLGLGVPLSWAIIRGLSRASTPFHRTPKRGQGTRRRYRAGRHPVGAAIRGALGLSLAGSVANLLAAGMLPAVPFTGLFAAGYLATTRESFRRDGVDH